MLHRPHDAACSDCHQPHSWEITGRDVCLTCHDDKKDHYAKDKATCETCHGFTKS